MATQNQNILNVYNALCDQQDALSAKIQTTTDPKLAATISTQIQEIAHRIILVQNLLFAADDAQITTAAAGIGKASQTLTTAIANIGNVTGFLNSVAAFLTVVDQVIDIATKLAAAA
jgi:hypothetical protein